MVTGITKDLIKCLCKIAMAMAVSKAIINLAKYGALHQLTIPKSTSCFSKAQIGKDLATADNKKRAEIKILTIKGKCFFMALN
jgi:hypothetical protein